jgi:hypothetical protein
VSPTATWQPRHQNRLPKPPDDKKNEQFQELDGQRFLIFWFNGQNQTSTIVRWKKWTFSFLIGYVIIIDSGIFLYLFCLDFRKINGRIKNFEKCTSVVVPHGGGRPIVVPHDGSVLAPWGMAAAPRLYKRPTPATGPSVTPPNLRLSTL